MNTEKLRRGYSTAKNDSELVPLSTVQLAVTMSYYYSPVISSPPVFSSLLFTSLLFTSLHFTSLLFSSHCTYFVAYTIQCNPIVVSSITLNLIQLLTCTKAGCSARHAKLHKNQKSLSDPEHTSPGSMSPWNTSYLPVLNLSSVS